METIPAPLKGKVAIITGGSRGIGAALVKRFAELGCTHIAITYSSAREKADQVLAGVREVSPKIKSCAVAADLFDAEFGPKLVQQTLAGLGVDHIDIVVSNAAATGMGSFCPVAQLTHDTFVGQLAASAWAPLSLARAAVDHMPRGGRIVIVSSHSSKFAMGDPTVAYAAGKAALDAVSKNLAALWAVEKGITVNSISVGNTRTESLEDALQSWGPGMKKTAEGMSMLKRLGEVDEVANVIAFVASPQAALIVGNQVPANGGGIAVLQS